MRYSTLWLAILTVSVVGSLPGCGGGGHGLRVPSTPIAITSNALPAINSGEDLNYAIPFTGGAGGPYMLEVILGTTPAGVALDPLTVSLVGAPLEDGDFTFRLKLTDLGTSPATTSIMDYQWTIGVGALVLVSDPVLPSWVYNRFDAAALVVAGGEAPYTAIDLGNPNPPVNDGLPLGLSIPTGSTSVVGAPLETEGENGGTTPPFTYHVPVRIFDSAVPARTLDVVVTVQVQVPPLIVTTSTLANGTCGTNYTDQVGTAEGIPPFLHSIIHVEPPLGTLADSDGSYRMMGEVGTSGGVAKGTPTSAYAAETDTSAAYTDRFPEGMYVNDATGDIQGVPRRRGQFNTWKYLVQSVTLPFVASQNVTKTFSFSIADSYPATSVLMDPMASIIAPGQGFTPPNNSLVNGDYGRTYDRTYAASGGVPMDGWYDAPHETVRVTNPAETAGAYDWSTTTFAVEPPSAYNMTFDARGRFRTLSATGISKKFGPRDVFPRVVDFQLPTFASPPTGHMASNTNQFAVGPDILVITESLGSQNSVAVSMGQQYSDNQNVEICEAYATGPVVRNPTSADFQVGQLSNATTASPSNNLQGLDFMTASVNPTWWAYDNYNLNAKAARAGQNADPDRCYIAQSDGGDGYRTKAYYYCAPEYSGSIYGYGTAYVPGFEHAANLAVQMPDCTAAVTHDPTGASTGGVGQYTDGGLLYPFTREPSSGSGEFGILILRRDGKLYVPFSLSRTTSYTVNGTSGIYYDGFGDGWIAKGSSIPQGLKRPQMTVSPDGRIAAMKLKRSVATWNETASSTAIVLFSLTGERLWGGNTYRIIATGSNGNTSSGIGGSLGRFQYADSLTLTNRYLYYITGNYGGTDIGYSYAPWNVCKEHWLWHFDTTYVPGGSTTGSGNVGVLIGVPVANGGGPTNLGGASGSSPYYRSASDATFWPAANCNTAGHPMQSPYHAWYTPGCSSISMPGTYAGGQPGYGYASAGTTGPSPSFFTCNWANFATNSNATHPFRVSANGKAVVFLAGWTRLSLGSSFGYQSTSYPSSPSYYPYSSGYTNGPEMYAVYTEFDGDFAAGTYPVTRRINNAYLDGASFSMPWRHFRPSRRGGIALGNDYYRNDGWGDGPANQLEISDDGTKVACVWNDPAGPNYGYSYWYYSSSYYSSTPYGPWNGKEDILSWVGTGAAGDPWANTTELNVTRTCTPNLLPSSATQVFPNYAGSYYVFWRMGCLAFTRDGNALVFWVGMSNNRYGSFSNYDNNCFALTGSLYAAKYSGATITQMASILSGTTQGASSEGTKLFWNGSSVTTCSITYSAGSGAPGGILPNGVFFSNDGRFFYVCSEHGIDSGATQSSQSSGATSHRLIGVNVATAATGTINGRLNVAATTFSTNMTSIAFAPTWSAGTAAYHRGFGPTGSGILLDFYYWAGASTTTNYAYYNEGNVGRWSGGLSSSANSIGSFMASRANKGHVYWVGYEQMNPFGDQNYTGYYSGSLTTSGAMCWPWPSAIGDFGICNPEILMFDANVGGNPIKLTNLGIGGVQYQYYFAYSGQYFAARTIPYMQLDDAGNRLAFVEAESYPISTTYYGPCDHQLTREKLWVISGIATTSSGTLSGTPTVTNVETVQGRVSSVLAFDTLGSRLYYGYGGTANENQMSLTDASVAGSTVSKRTIPGYLSSLARFAVLWCYL